MDNTEITNVLIQIANTLNTIEVKGKQNMMGLIGSIGAIEDLVNKMLQQQKADGVELPKS